MDILSFLMPVCNQSFYIVVRFGHFTLIKGNVTVELKYDSFIPNKVQMKYAKYMLGVHKSATNIAVLAELGLYPLSIAALKSSVIYWIHLLN